MCASVKIHTKRNKQEPQTNKDEQGRSFYHCHLVGGGGVTMLRVCDREERKADTGRQWSEVNVFGKANDTRKRSVLKTETCTGEHAIVCECRVLHWMEERRQKEDEIPISKDVLSLFLFVFTWQLPLGTYFTFRFQVSVLATFVVTLFRTTFWSFVALSLTLTFKCNKKKTATTYTGAEIC